MRLLRLLKEKHPFKTSPGTLRPVYVYANQKNAGDFLSAKGVQAAVGVEGAEYLIEGDRPHNFLVSDKIELRKLIIGGGGLLMDYFKPFWEKLLSSGATYLLFGVGACNIKGRNRLLPNTLLKDIVINARQVWIRDRMTFDLIEGVCGIKTHRLLCPSVYHIVSKYGIGSEMKSTRLRPKILYVHHRKLVETAGQGDNFARNIVKTFCKLNGFAFAETDNMTNNIDKLVGKYLDADMIISTRLHGCIISYALNKPFVAVSADMKIDSFVNDYCNAVTICINRLSADILNDVIRENFSLSPRRDDFSSFIEEIKNTGEFIKQTVLCCERTKQP